MVSNGVPPLSLGWVRATANTLMEQRIGSCHPAPLQSWRRERRDKRRVNMTLPQWCLQETQAKVTTTNITSPDTHRTHWEPCGGLQCGDARNPGAIVIKKEEGGSMEGLRSTEQSTLTLTTISAQCLPRGKNHQKGHIYKLGGVVFIFSCPGQTN